MVFFISMFKAFRSQLRPYKAYYTYVLGMFFVKTKIKPIQSSI